MKQTEDMRRKHRNQNFSLAPDMFQKTDKVNVFSAGLMKKMLKRRSTIKKIEFQDSICNSSPGRPIEPSTATVKSPYEALLADKNQVSNEKESCIYVEEDLDRA